MMRPPFVRFAYSMAPNSDATRATLMFEVSSVKRRRIGFLPR